MTTEAAGSDWLDNLLNDKFVDNTAPMLPNPTPNPAIYNFLNGDDIHRGEIEKLAEPLIPIRLTNTEIAMMEAQNRCTTENVNAIATNNSSFQQNIDAPIAGGFSANNGGGSDKNMQINEKNNSSVVVVEDAYISTGARPKTLGNFNKSSSPNLSEKNSQPTSSSVSFSASAQNLTSASFSLNLIEIKEKRVNPLFRVAKDKSAANSVDDEEILKRKFRFWMRPVINDDSVSSVTILAVNYIDNLVKMRTVKPEDKLPGFHYSSSSPSSSTNLHIPSSSVAPPAPVSVWSSSPVPKKNDSKCVRRCKFCKMPLTEEYADVHEFDCYANPVVRRRKDQERELDMAEMIERFRQTPNPEPADWDSAPRHYYRDLEGQMNEFFVEGIGNDYVQIPCEFCENLVHAKDLYQHQRECRESSANRR